MKNKRKNKIFTIAVISLILIIGGLFIYSFFYQSNLKELNVDEVIEKINNKESFVLCISQTTCAHCASYKPKLEKASNNYNIEIFYIDIDKYEQEEINEFKKNISFDGSTPVTAFIIDGEETTASNRIFGNSSYDKIVSKLKSNGFIEE